MIRRLFWLCAIVALVGSTPSAVQASPSSSSATARHAHTLFWGDLARPAAGSPYAGLRAVSAVSAHDVWAVGLQVKGAVVTTLVEQWDGRSWSTVPSPNPAGSRDSRLVAVSAIGASNVWAAGSFQAGSGSMRTLVEHWNGSSWRRVPSPNASVTGTGSRLTAISAVSTDDVWAVGYDDPPGRSVAHTTTLHWNGGSWSVIRTFNPVGKDRGFFGVSATTASSAWAVGSALDPDASRTTALVEHWNGLRWNRAPIRSPGAAANDLDAVSVVAPGNAWAVGLTRETSGGRPRPLVEHLSGGRWLQVRPPGLGRVGFLTSVSGDAPDDVWMVGFLAGANLLEHWDGHGWSMFHGPGATVPSTLSGLTTHGTTATWAVGIHRVAGGAYQPLTERWNGHVWTR